MNANLSLATWTPTALLLTGLGLQMSGMLICWLLLDAFNAVKPIVRPVVRQLARDSANGAPHTTARIVPFAAKAYPGRAMPASAMIERDAA